MWCLPHDKKMLLSVQTISCVITYNNIPALCLKYPIHSTQHTVYMARQMLCRGHLECLEAFDQLAWCKVSTEQPQKGRTHLSAVAESQELTCVMDAVMRQASGSGQPLWWTPGCQECTVEILWLNILWVGGWSEETRNRLPWVWERREVEGERTDHSGLSSPFRGLI